MASQKKESGKDSKGDGKNEQPIFCMSCGESLSRDHSGITCLNDHHICNEDECARNFVTHVLSEGPSAIPVKCMDCHVDIVPNTFERNVPIEQQAAYAELCVLVGGNPELGTRWHRCPLCPNMIILVESEGEMIYNCLNCSDATCMVCSAKVDGEREYETHVVQCGAHGALRNDLLDVVNRASQAQCPKCDHKGQKDDACCHMTCPQCHTRWCYVCEMVRGEADGGEWGHNSDWKSNPARCPMYLDYVHKKNPEWPTDGQESVSYFHARKIRFALRQKIEAVGQGKVEEMLEHFPATLAPYTLEEVMEATAARNF